MSSPKSLIYGLHFNAPKFNLADAQLRFSVDDPHKLVSETTSTTFSHKKRSSMTSSVNSFPILAPDALSHIGSPRIDNASFMSIKQESLPISFLYKSPRPTHHRHLSDIPILSYKDMELEHPKRQTEVMNRNKNPFEPKMVQSMKESMTLNLRQNSTSITSLHTPENQTDIEKYLRYLSKFSKPSQLRKTLEEKIYGKHPLPRHSSMLQESSISYKLVHIPSAQDSKSGSFIGGRSPSNGRSFLSRKPSFDSQIQQQQQHSDTIIENSTNKSTVHVKAKPKLKPINFKPREGDSPDGSLHDSPPGLTPKKSTSKLTHSHSRRTLITQELHWHNQHSDLFIDIANNLKALYTLIANEKKIHQTIEKFANNNAAVINLLSSKVHKIVDYDSDKLQKKFSMIEVSSENLSIPEKLEKQRLGISIVEPNLIRDLGYFNAKLEDFILQKKQESLKLIEDRLIRSENKLWDIQQKKLTELKQKGRIKEYNYAEKILAQKPRIDPFYFFQFDPVSTIDSYQQNNGELKFVKKKNLEHARTIAQVFDSWVSHINNS